MTTTDRSQIDTAKRIETLEGFVRHVRDVGETLELIGRTWGGDEGDGLSAYGRQLREAATAVLEDDGELPLAIILAQTP